MIASTQFASVEIANQRQFQRRMSIATTLAVLLFAGITYRLFSKSILEHSSYVALASNQHTIREELPSHRGTIYAHDGGNALYPVATNARTFDVNVIPSQVINPKALAAAIAPILGLDEHDLADKFASKVPYLPPLKHRIDKATADKLAAIPLKGISLVPTDTRFYPEGEYADQLLGYVNFDSVGTYGIEHRYDDVLQGKSGTLLGQKDTFGRLVSITGQVNPEPGSDLVLTLDHTIQFIADQALKQAITNYGAGGGSVIVLNPKTGALLALANQPGFDPNSYNTVPSDQQNRFLNDAVSTTYEPGSIMKPVVMATAINEGKLTPDTTSTFANFVTVQGYQIHTALDKAYGTETMTQVLENSDNVGMVWVAGHLEYQDLYDSFKKFGFGQPTGIDLPGETAGSVLPVKSWHDINRATMAFGQGISVTPIEMAMAWGSLINGGKLMKPYVVEKIIRPSGDVVITQPTEVRETVSQDTADKVRGMLLSVVDNGQSHKAQIPGYSIAGKTGTAQIADPHGGYLADSWNHSFIGFFPANDPQYLVMVKLDHPTSSIYADATALPTFRSIATGIISATELPPDR